ncbi:addiction module protein [Prosthecobacter sp. SYSU 5D2]|uniref:addiction module protein n=1 Tax=Prosthecobacter sp. SYSU 5D2 TaxID=3134134 RepID=UPI0031FE6436
MSTMAFPETLFSLPVAERIALADRLYASVPEDWQRSTDEAWLAEAERRSAEMEADPSLELSYEEFMAGIQRPKRLL